MCLCDVMGNRKVKSIPVWTSFRSMGDNMGVMGKCWETYWAMTGKTIGQTMETLCERCSKLVENYKGTMNGSRWRRAGEVNGK